MTGEKERGRGTERLKREREREDLKRRQKKNYVRKSGDKKNDPSLYFFSFVLFLLLPWPSFFLSLSTLHFLFILPPDVTPVTKDVKARA